VNYTKGDETDLPSNDSNLETNYTAQEVSDVALVDVARVAQTATSQYAIHQYKLFSTAPAEHNECFIMWTGQTDSVEQVIIQIYNQVNNEWETLFTSPSDYGSSITTYGSGRATYGGHLVDTDFVLSSDITNLTEYIDDQGLVSCRVYQHET